MKKLILQVMSRLVSSMFHSCAPRMNRGLGAHQRGAGSEIKCGLLLDGAVRAVTFGGIGSAEKQGVRRLVALKVEDAESLTFFDFMHPPIACGDHFAEDGIFWDQ